MFTPALREGRGFKHQPVELVNTTPVPAALNVASVPGRAERRGLITAKATFRLGAGGPELDVDDPRPLFDDDEPTALGLLPRDDVPRRDGRCEVILLGAACAPSGKPIDRRTVRLVVGDTKRELAVFGDRVWEGRGSGARVGRPEPFERMPLVWERAFGGTAEVLVDEESYVDIADPRNPRGAGIDVTRAAEEMCRAWKAPAGYPVLPSVRRLPNLEDPGALIQGWEDAPEPVCWATAPLGVDLHLLRELAGYDPEAPPPMEVLARPRPRYACHPDLLLDVPAAGTPVVASGVRPLDEPFSFRIPNVRIWADHIVGRHRGTRELRLETLVLLPEERRFYMVLRHAFTVPYRPEEERAMRVRVEVTSGGKTP